MTWNPLLLGLVWILWCVMHSLLISRRLSNLVKDRLGRNQYYYRLFFNIFAIATILPAIALTALHRGEKVFAWQGWYHLVQFALLLFALWLFRDGGRHYDFGYFAGIKQIQEKEHLQSLSADNSFSKSGAHGLTRHPWYLGGIIFLWTFLPVYYQSSVTTAVILTMYFCIGTLLEERKLVEEFGSAYREYQSQVSMLFPWKWILKRLRGKR